MATATAAQPSPRSDSNWWLVVAAGLVVHVLAYVAFFAVFAVVWLAILTGNVTDAPFPGFLFAGGGLVVALLAMGVVFLVGLVLPVALYLDADAVKDASDDWDPDPMLYGLAAFVGLFVQGVPLQPAVAFYYLYKRHQHLGTP